MTNPNLTKVVPNAEPHDLTNSVKTDTDQLQEAENEGLAPIVPSNPATHQKLVPPS